MKRVWTVFAFVVLVCSAWAQNGTITLTAFPSLLVADGRSPTTISAEVRDNAGNLVPDRTPVLFETNLGELRDTLVETRDGIAQVVLTSGNTPGIARVRASALRFQAAGQVQVEFVESGQKLDALQDFVELQSDDALFYAFQERILEATAGESGVHLKYRDIEIEADDLQFNVPAYEVKAKNGVLRTKEYTLPFRSLSITLNTGRGEARAIMETTRWRWQQSGRLAIVEPVEGTQTVNVQFSRTEFQEIEETTANFEFQTIFDSLTKIHAKRVVAFPAREIQFQSADVKIAETTIMRVPLYRIGVFETNPIITEQYVTVSNNDFQVDYPHYLQLSPGYSSRMRFRYGQRYGTGVGGSGGMFLDYELGWNEGSNREGGLTFTGLGRDDWGLSLRQAAKPSDRTYFQAQLTMPAHSSLIGNTTMTHAFDGLQLSLSANYSQSLKGISTNSFLTNFIGELDPWKWGDLPFRTFMGFSADYQEFRGPVDSSRRTAGLRFRTISQPLRFGPSHTLTLNHQVRYDFETDQPDPVVNTLAVNMASQLGPKLSVNTAYEYGSDFFTRQALGSHRLTFDAFYYDGPFRFSSYVSRSLDLDRMTLSGQAMYRVGPLWRTYFNFYHDRFLGQEYRDQSVILSYQLGFREIGLSYSWRTRRIGFELLGTRVR